MLDWLILTVTVLALLLAAWCGWAAYRDSPTKDWHFAGMAVVELAVLVQLVVALAQLGHGDRPAQGMAVFLAYLLGAVCAVPAAAMMSLAERTRWGSTIVAAGGVILAVLELRLNEIWGAGHG
ncbi:membrane protein [Actinacidiphila yeochonensis]|uniref:membrane protein n=1 Tax=Actinacidiphila yeochonensis TaxID=89050 RepID=UPI00055A472F|nr:membrane protein [Actinacidiphila yeochonensis]